MAIRSGRLAVAGSLVLACALAANVAHSPPSAWSGEAHTCRISRTPNSKSRPMLLKVRCAFAEAARHMSAHTMVIARCIQVRTSIRSVISVTEWLQARGAPNREVGCER